MTLPNELIRHLSRVYDDVVASSYPQTFEEVCGHYERGTCGFGASSSYLLTVDPRSPHRASVSVAVDPECRRMGQGEMALRLAQARAREELKCEWLDGWLWRDNMAALKMDMRFGFKVVGKIRDAWRQPGGRSRDMLLVTKRIG